MCRLVVCLALIGAGGLCGYVLSEGEAGTAKAQTIIPLDPRAGGVRSKTIDDYKEEMGMAERQRADSLQYVDNLRRAFNALYTDSLSEAEQLLQEALKLRPQAPGNHIVKYNLGLVDMARGHYVEAAEKLTLILKEYPYFWDARLARAESYLQTGKHAEAIQDTEDILLVNSAHEVPEDVMYRARFVRAAARYALRQYHEAYTDLTFILRENPSDISVQVLEALTLQRMGRPKEALNKLNLIVASNPENTDALAARASVEEEMQLHVQACDDYTVLIRLNPDDSGYYIARAKLRIALGEKHAAKSDLDAAVRLGVPRGMVHALYMNTK